MRISGGINPIFANFSSGVLLAKTMPNQIRIACITAIVKGT